MYMKRRSVLLAAVTLFTAGSASAQTWSFDRVATMLVTANLPGGADRNKKTVAEIVAASEDGRTLAYANAERGAVGFVDIANPAEPRPAGELDMGGEVTSVTVLGQKVIVAVVTSKDKKAPAGHVATIDLISRRIESRCDVGGQPDSIAKSPDRQFIAVAVENERDEDLEKGKLPQLPAGDLRIMTVSNGVADCNTMKSVALTGLAQVAPEDPEPEFVDINDANEAVVTLQENNHIAIVDLAAGKVVTHFSAGTVTFDRVDTKRDGVIKPENRLEAISREPDAVKWLDRNRFVTANEGDYLGGGRGFTIFNRDGRVEWDSGSTLEHLAMAHGHYPERRSGNKGTEPEGIEVARYGDDTYLFVGTERSSFVAVYRDRGPGQAPEYMQLLPAGVGPEGLTAIPSRDLFVVANEVDNPDTGARSSIMIYGRINGSPAYPTIISDSSATGTPIAWGALSGLSSDPGNANRLFAVTDSFYAQGKILTIDAGANLAKIIAELVVTKGGQPAVNLDLRESPPAHRAASGWRRRAILNGKRVQQTICCCVFPQPVRSKKRSRFRIASGELPRALGTKVLRSPVTGVRRQFGSRCSANGRTTQKGWSKLVPTSRRRGHGGSSIIPSKHFPARVGSACRRLRPWATTLLSVIERDNQIGDAAKVKRLYRFSTAGLIPAEAGKVPAVVNKTLVRDLLPDLQAPNGYVLEKVEGFTVAGNGQAFAVTDNDGVDGSSGETQFLRLGRLSAGGRAASQQH